MTRGSSFVVIVDKLRVPWDSLTASSAAPLWTSPASLLKIRRGLRRQVRWQLHCGLRQQLLCSRFVVGFVNSFVGSFNVDFAVSSHLVAGEKMLLRPEAAIVVVVDRLIGSPRQQPGCGLC